MTAETERSRDRDEAVLTALPASERRKLELSIRKRHYNCGHFPNHVLVRMLRWKGAKKDVLAAARLLRCSACEEAKPGGAKLVSASHENREPSRVVGCDLAEWNHPVSETRQCTCGHVSMRPRNSQLDTSGPKVNKLETLMVAVCWSCCRNVGYQSLDVRTHCDWILKERGATRKCTKG